MNALTMAIRRRKRTEGLIVHSDRGSQHCCHSCQSFLAENAFISSMSAKADPWDNAVAESFFASFKVELIHGELWLDEIALRREILEYTEIFYNRERQHSASGYLSPAQFLHSASILFDVA
jgi:transposase InsO family protein